jgi:hypothetical protein
MTALTHPTKKELGIVNSKLDTPCLEDENPGGHACPCDASFNS